MVLEAHDCSLILSCYVYPDTPDMVESMGKTEFQKMISGEQVVLPIKNEQKSLQLTLDMHALMVSNYIQKCQEAGEISRRLATLLFKPVSGKDATLKHKTIKETPLIFIKTLLAYRHMKSKYEHLPFSEWGIEYFDNKRRKHVVRYHAPSLRKNNKNLKVRSVLVLIMGRRVDMMGH
jgi:hypothetical protein